MKKKVKVLGALEGSRGHIRRGGKLFLKSIRSATTPLMVQNCRFMTNYSLLHLIPYLAIEKTTIQIEMDGFLGGYRLTKGKIRFLALF